MKKNWLTQVIKLTFSLCSSVPWTYFCLSHFEQCLIFLKWLFLAWLFLSTPSLFGVCLQLFKRLCASPVLQFYTIAGSKLTKFRSMWFFLKISFFIYLHVTLCEMPSIDTVKEEKLLFPQVTTVKGGYGLTRASNGRQRLPGHYLKHFMWESLCLWYPQFLYSINEHPLTYMYRPVLDLTSLNFFCIIVWCLLCTGYPGTLKNSAYYFR